MIAMRPTIKRPPKMMLLRPIVTLVVSLLPSCVEKIKRPSLSFAFFATADDVAVAVARIAANTRSTKRRQQKEN